MQNTQQAREERQDHYDARAHTFPDFYQLPHWRSYVKLVREIEVISAESLPEELGTDDRFSSSDFGEHDSQG